MEMTKELLGNTEISINNSVYIDKAVIKNIRIDGQAKRMIIEAVTDEDEPLELTYTNITAININLPNKIWSPKRNKYLEIAR